MSATRARLEQLERERAENARVIVGLEWVTDLCVKNRVDPEEFRFPKGPWDEVRAADGGSLLEIPAVAILAEIARLKRRAQRRKPDSVVRANANKG